MNSIRPWFDTALGSLWREFDDVPMDLETECIEKDWQIWRAGTNREVIWHWFDEMYSRGVIALMQCRKGE